MFRVGLISVSALLRLPSFRPRLPVVWLKPTIIALEARLLPGRRMGWEPLLP